MICAIYKSSKKEGAYLYVPKKDDFSQVPDQLMQMFGKPTMVMVVKLEGRTLAQVNVEKVKQSMNDEGYFLQLPPPPKKFIRRIQRTKSTSEI